MAHGKHWCPLLFVQEYPETKSYSLHREVIADHFIHRAITTAAATTVPLPATELVPLLQHRRELLLFQSQRYVLCMGIKHISTMKRLSDGSKAPLTTTMARVAALTLRPTEERSEATWRE